MPDYIMKTHWAAANKLHTNTDACKHKRLALGPSETNAIALALE